MPGGMGQPGMGSYYGSAYGPLSASMAAAVTAAAQQSAAMSIAAPAQVREHTFIRIHIPYGEREKERKGKMERRWTCFIFHTLYICGVFVTFNILAITPVPLSLSIAPHLYLAFVNDSTMKIETQRPNKKWALSMAGFVCYKFHATLRILKIMWTLTSIGRVRRKKINRLFECFPGIRW